MMFKSDVDRIARAHLTRQLSEYPGALRILLREDLFGKWCELCAQRCVQIDTWAVTRGHKLTQKMVVDFIEDAARAYGRKQLDRLGEYGQLVRSST